MKYSWWNVGVMIPEFCTMIFLRFYPSMKFQLFDITLTFFFVFCFLINTTFQFVSFGIMSFIYHLKWRAHGQME